MDIYRIRGTIGGSVETQTLGHIVTVDLFLLSLFTLLEAPETLAKTRNENKHLDTMQIHWSNPRIKRMRAPAETRGRIDM
jgi:hypothetical protein